MISDRVTRRTHAYLDRKVRKGLTEIPFDMKVYLTGDKLQHH